MTEDFIQAACVPLDSGHASGTLERANANLAAHPDIAASDIYTAAILGDDGGVRRWLERDPAGATATGGPRGWDALTYLCFSRYLRLDRTRSEGFVRAATALLDAGASANTGWFEHHHQPKPEWESALYGAAAIAQHPELTRLLLDRGADPNDEETAYHVPETYDNTVLKILVETNRLTADNLSMMLIRKHDWHDYDGARYLLDHGADPNLNWRGRFSALQHALRRDNALRMFELLLDHGADPTRTVDGISGVALAAREGRGDVLELFNQRNIPIALDGVDRLIAACAMGDAAAVRAIVEAEPALARELVAMGGALLAKFSGTGNAAGVRQLLGLGVEVAAPFAGGDGYWGIPKGALAIHVAAWRAQHAVVRLLIERGSPIDQPDGNGRTPLALAVRACVDSYWMQRRAPESVKALLDAGASTSGIAYPSGYAEIDAHLKSAAPARSSSPSIKP
jgi:ankyrin repeat protein